MISARHRLPMAVLVALAIARPDLCAAAATLTWQSCSVAASSRIFCFACDSNEQSRAMVAWFRAPLAVPDFVGVSLTIDVELSHPGVPPWWQIGPGGCREGALTLVGVSDIASCGNPYAGAMQAGGMVIEPRIYPNYFRIRADWARESPTALEADSSYVGAVFRFHTGKTVGEEAEVCAGCSAAAALQLNLLDVWGINSHLEFYGTPFEDTVEYLTPGYLGCSTPARTSTWGAVKALYR